MGVKIVQMNFAGVQIFKMRIQTTYKFEVIYKFDKNTILIAESYSDLVSQMRSFVYAKPQTNEEHRIQTKKRFYNWDKTILDTTNDKSFVQSLIDCGYLRVLSYSRKPLKSQ